jgi:hypothetical protein
VATRLTQLPSLAPDPLNPTPDQVAEYVAAVQGLSRANAEVARREAWRQIRLAGARAGRRPDEAHATLDRIFRLGLPPDPPLDGATRGILVTPMVSRAVDLGLRALAAAWLPWTGKRFDAATSTGENLLAAGARGPARLVWPSYRLQAAEEGYTAFRFRTHVGPGAVDPELQTLKIDYDSDENPRFLIRDILDELVQIVPGAYLGKVLLRRAGRWRPVGYFALEPAVSGLERPAGEVAEAAVTAA